MSVESAFRSSQPDVLAQWAEMGAGLAEWDAICKRWADDLGEDREIYYRRSVTGIRLVGVGWPKPGPAWRDSGRDGWVPYRNAKKDPELVERFDASRVSWSALPGMPSDTWTMGESGSWGMRTFTPGIAEMDGSIYVTWGCPADLVKGVGDQWERLKLSEYHAALEAHEAAKASA